MIQNLYYSVEILAATWDALRCLLICIFIEGIPWGLKNQSLS